MYLVRLVYASQTVDNFNLDAIEQILASARKHNTANDLTGLLCFSNKYFLQCLEGSRSKVNETYHRILKDPRHKNIMLLDYHDIVQREFSEWQMAYIPESSITAPLTLKYSGGNEFNPYKMSGPSAHRLMLELRKAVPSI